MKTDSVFTGNFLLLGYQGFIYVTDEIITRKYSRTIKRLKKDTINS